MDDTSQILITANATADHSFNDDMDGEDTAEDDDEEESCDVEAWETLSKGFKEVQSVLDHNRRLIQQVNDNHRSKIPSNLAKNVDLIREINSNISKVIGLYSNLSTNFSSIVQQRRAVSDKIVKNVES
ncbi:UNVERIFIED_CONTAM: protein ELF4-LIKE 1 [Sesamum latifolium]|uniref:Protein ELF4-LIKE 1 n=1 Tax=Sesamum latifolium TaxID=2727402 RepID=A0AAW2XXW0_9LAMI